jgi:broad specificity phosphatase PhoE
MMPKNLILVRHGETESNQAVKAARNGDDALLLALTAAKHDSIVRLTTKGVSQILQTKKWLEENVLSVPGFVFNRCYVSEYIRAMESAATLDLDGVVWFVDRRLRERSRGIDNHFTPEERANEVILQRYDAFKKSQPLYWPPIGGESIAEHSRDFRSVLDTLHRECENQNVLIVCHGEVMWEARLILEHMTQEEYNRLDASEHPKDRINNGQILHYTREDPVNPSVVATSYRWMRSVCPSIPELASPNCWQEIIRKKYSNADLRARVNAAPPILL